MGGTFAQPKVWADGELIDAAGLNANPQGIIANMNPAGIDDESSTLAAMRAVANPFPAGAESAPTSLQGELQRLRYQIAAITGQSYWQYPYIHLDGFLSGVSIVNNGTHADHQLDCVVSGTSFTVDIAASGLNGLDTGSEAATTWYYVWVISNGTTMGGLLSTSYLNPTMPTGYTFKYLIGAVYNGAADFITIKQKGNRVNVAPAALMTNTLAASWSSIFTVNFNTIVPATAKAASGYCSITATTDPGYLYLAVDGSGTGQIIFYAPPSGTSVAPFHLPIFSAQTWYHYETNIATDSVVISGWEY